MLQQLFRRTHLDMGDAGVAQREALGEAVGAMGKADPEAILGRQHVRRSLKYAQREISQQQFLVPPALAHALQR